MTKKKLGKIILDDYAIQVDQFLDKIGLEGQNHMVNHPSHYTSHPSGIECIQIAEHYNFNIGNTIKYLWRVGLKGDAVEDLEKAAWYLNREIEKRKTSSNWIQGNKFFHNGELYTFEGNAFKLGMAVTLKGKSLYLPASTMKAWIRSVE